ncbi:MAG: c-type cytochrome, partial [Planctomycetes bacterium]|nr:c-type cytochrome [Planctomycetota bacterium]
MRGELLPADSRRYWPLVWVSLGLGLAVGATLGAPRPTPVPVPEVGGNGHAETWDGRVFVITRGYQGRIGWVVRVLRPEGVRLAPSGQPTFGGAFSPEVGLEFNGDPGGLTDHNALAIVPTPGVGANPFRSDAGGQPRAGGAYLTYDALVYTQRYAPQDDRMGQRRLQIVIAEPYTPQARVQSARFLTDFQELRAGNSPLRGIEPTATFDGHLLIWQGHPDNDGKIDVLMYSTTQTPGATQGWSPPRSIADLYHRDRDTLVGGIPLRERAPLAAQPLRANDGSEFRRGDLYRGAYPWVTRDGTELFHTTTIAGQVGVNRARRGGFSVIGRWTNWRLRHIDGPLNPDREATVRLFFSSPGATPSFWRPFPELANLPIPVTPRRPVFPLFGSNTSNYGEVDFADVVDGDYTLALSMNELLRKDTSLDPSRTPDTSGHGHVGLLEGARFPQEQSGREVLVGAVGQGLSFDGDAKVRVRHHPALSSDALTCELFVKRTADLSATPGAYQFLVNKPGAFDLILEANGVVQASVHAGGARVRSGGVGPALPLDTWVHVAFTYRPDGTLQVYLDGDLRHTARFPAAPLASSSSDLLIGPGRQTPGTYPQGQPLVVLDELRLSRVARTAEELRATAYLPAPAPSFAGRLPDPLPAGLDPAALKIPGTTTVSRERIALGELLFFDPRLSATGAVACSSCHDPARGFGDGFATAVGLNGQSLRRNTPTVVNRAFGTLQFWDGRSPDLEAQARVPLEHPDEMGLPIAQAVDRLRQIPDYAARFRAAFGGQVDAAKLQQALADYQRSLLSGNSRVDRFELGQANALSASEARGRTLFRGKARCTACHSGTNYSDEAFHDTGFQPARADLGRSDVSGRSAHQGAFKTPTLRDVSRTAPYLHDGSVATLEEVVELYDRGGRTAAGRDPEVRPLGLSAQERADLVAFLRALESTTVS